MIDLTVDVVESTIQNLERINPDNEFAYEKALLAFLKIPSLPIFVVDLPKGMPVCRSRIQDNSDLFEQVSEICMPPQNYVRNFARCNRPFQSKFYCSENRPVSYLELINYWVGKKKVGDRCHVTIGRWILKNPISAIIVTSPDRSERESEYDKIYGAALDSFLAQFSGEFLSATINFYRYLNGKFREPVKENKKIYIITTAYCNLALTYTQNNVAAIAYSSVQDKESGINYCINADSSINANLELTHVLQNEFVIKMDSNERYCFEEVNCIEAKEIGLGDNKIAW